MCKLIDIRIGLIVSLLRFRVYRGRFDVIFTDSNRAYCICIAIMFVVIVSIEIIHVEIIHIERGKRTRTHVL